MCAGRPATCTVVFRFVVPFVNFIPRPSSFACLQYQTWRRGEGIGYLSLIKQGVGHNRGNTFSACNLCTEQASCMISALQTFVTAVVKKEMNMFSNVFCWLELLLTSVNTVPRYKYCLKYGKAGEGLVSFLVSDFRIERTVKRV